jgi:hypothetical protein
MFVLSGSKFLTLYKNSRLIKIKITKLIAFDDLCNGTTLRTISYDHEVTI